MVKAGINENLKQLMDTYNLNLPLDISPIYNRGETKDLEHLCSTLQDLSLYDMGLVVITFIKP